ncbi:MAG: hypothetical protein M3075_16265 [Candidatus Dormibacteraeota bacterium]|nr:hypothetical protein [Candidatus Dormibacteraeota bacterium]
MTDPSLQRAAAAAAIAAAVVGLLYSISFVVVSRLSPASGALLSALFLLLGGLLGVVAFLGVYDRRREDRPAFSLLFVIFGAAGGLGAAVHGGYDLANALHPPASLPGDVPNPVDPRGFLTFGVTGLALLLLGALVQEGPGRLAYLAGGLLILVYLARLIVLAPTSPLVLVPAALAGFVVNPAFYLWLGLWLRRPRYV